jgi:beta-glucosidase
MTDAATDPAAITTGTGYWETAELADPPIRALRVADGPHGLRIQDDDNPDHLGLGRSRPATCFPPAVTLASSWDAELVGQVGAALGYEAAAAGVDVVLGPGVNIKRSPLCGRNFEYFSEDPLLTGRLGGAMVAGIQSNAVAACLKHFAANNQETDRLRVSAIVGERALREIYLRSFQVALREAPSWTIMSAYNRINGVYASENAWLLDEVLRGEWGYDGVVVSDWGAVHDPVAALSAGLDLRMPGRPDDRRVRQALDDGVIESAALDRTLDRMQRLAERTERSGEAIDLDDMHRSHHELTRRAAAESAVLLQNDGALPLTPRPGLRVAVLGELARSPRYQGAGSSAVNPTRVTSALETLTAAIEASGGKVEFARGYGLEAASEDAALASSAADVLRRADIGVVFVGLPPFYETEGRDRTSIDLPHDQLRLLSALAEVDAPVVVALCNGSAVTTSAWRGGVNAVVEFWLTGQAHGEAICDVLFGRVNPSGKLAETIPVRLEDSPAFLNFPGEAGEVLYGEGVFVGYRHFDAVDSAVDHPFGHGLSYTTFEYSELFATAGSDEDEIALSVRLTLTNTGSRAGAEVVQLYLAEPSTLVALPPRQLRGFAKVALQPGESQTVAIDVPRSELGYFSQVLGRWISEPGIVRVEVGSSSRDIRLTTELHVEGEKAVIPLSEWSTWGEWRDDPEAGALLAEAIERGGGLRGRVADLIRDETGSQSVLALPLQTLVEFPGFPVEKEELHRMLASVAGR